MYCKTSEWKKNSIHSNVRLAINKLIMHLIYRTNETAWYAIECSAVNRTEEACPNECDGQSERQEERNGADKGRKIRNLIARWFWIWPQTHTKQIYK